MSHQKLLLWAVATFLVAFGIPRGIEGALYNNTVNGGATMAISNFTMKTYLGASKLYSSLATSANNNASQFFNADYQIYYQDISKGISARNRALGFMDVMVCVMVTPNNYTWRMSGDGDNRSDNDIRAVDGEGVVWDLIDTNYKPAYRTSLSANGGSGSSSATVWLTGDPTAGASAVTSYGKGGEFVIARMAVPSKPSGIYSLFLGKGILSAVDSAAQSYQVLLYTPIVTNPLIPVVHIAAPSLDGVYESTYDYTARIRTPSVKHVRVNPGVPIQFSAARSLNTSASEISSYEWDLGTGSYVAGGVTYTKTFDSKGSYAIRVRLTTASGLAVANDGLPIDTNYTLQTPALCPSALPYFVEVVDPPKSNTLARPRPSPFVQGVSQEMWLDFNIIEETPVNLGIYNLGGNLVRSLWQTNAQPVGFWGASWDGRDSKNNWVGEGLYYAVLTTKTGFDTKKVLVTRQ